MGLRVQVGCDFTYLAEVDTPAILQVQPVQSPFVSLTDEQ